MSSFIAKIPKLPKIPSISTIKQTISEKTKVVSEHRKKILSKLSICPKRKNLILDYDYEVEIAQPRDTENVVRFLKRNFFQREPLVKSLGLSLHFDPVIERIIEEDLKLGCSLLALRPGHEREIVGICVNEKCCPWECEALEKMACETKNAKVQYLLHMWSLMARESKLFETLHQHEFFGLDFLSVQKSFCGKGIGTELAKKSLALAKDLNYRYARMVCTSEQSSKIAEKLGMERAWRIPYKNILFEDSDQAVTIPPPPHNEASVYYIDLKRLPTDFVASNLK
jgi:hypothetical protein